EQAAVEILCAALGDDVDLREPTAAVFSGEGRRDDFEFSDGVDGRERVHRTRSNNDIRVVAAIDADVGRGTARSIDVDVGSGVGICTVGEVGRDTGRQLKQGKEGSPVQLQIAHLFSADEAALFRRVSLHRIGGGRYRDFLRHIAHLHRDVVAEVFAD